MSDVTVLPTGGTSDGGSKPNWLLIGAIGVGGVFLLLMLLRSQQSTAGQPTTAAGSSINAALGSIQEQNLNIMGEVGKTGQQLSNELSGVNNNVIVGGQQNAQATQSAADAIRQQILAAESIVYQGQTWQQAGPNDPRVGQWGQQATDYTNNANQFLSNLDGLLAQMQSKQLAGNTA